MDITLTQQSVQKHPVFMAARGEFSNFQEFPPGIFGMAHSQEFPNDPGWSLFETQCLFETRRLFETWHLLEHGP